MPQDDPFDRYRRKYNVPAPTETVEAGPVTAPDPFTLYREKYGQQGLTEAQRADLTAREAQPRYVAPAPPRRPTLDAIEALVAPLRREPIAPSVPAGPAERPVVRGGPGGEVRIAPRGAPREPVIPPVVARALDPNTPPETPTRPLGLGESAARMAVAQLDPLGRRRAQIEEDILAATPPDAISRPALTVPAAQRGAQPTTVSGADVLAAAATAGTLAKEYGVLRAAGAPARVVGGAAAAGVRRVVPKAVAEKAAELATRSTAASRVAGAGASAARGALEATAFGVIREGIEKGEIDQETLQEALKYAPYGVVIGSLFGAAMARPISPAREIIHPLDRLRATRGEPFRALGLDPATATEADVARAIRQKSAIWHPDVNQAAEAAETMAAYNEAAQAARAILRTGTARARPAQEPRPAAEPAPRPAAAPESPAAGPAAPPRPEPAPPRPPTPVGEPIAPVVPVERRAAPERRQATVPVEAERRVWDRRALEELRQSTEAARARAEATEQETAAARARRETPEPLPADQRAFTISHTTPRDVAQAEAIFESELGRSGRQREDYKDKTLRFGDAEYEVKNGQLRLPTVQAVKQAMGRVGLDQFQEIARQRIAEVEAAEGGPLSPQQRAAEVEDVARRILTEPQTAAAPAPSRAPEYRSSDVPVETEAPSQASLTEGPEAPEGAGIPEAPPRDDDLRQDHLEGMGVGSVIEVDAPLKSPALRGRWTLTERGWQNQRTREMAGSEVLREYPFEVVSAVAPGPEPELNVVPREWFDTPEWRAAVGTPMEQLERLRSAGPLDLKMLSTSELTELLTLAERELTTTELDLPVRRTYEADIKGFRAELARREGGGEVRPFPSRAPGASGAKEIMPAAGQEIRTQGGRVITFPKLKGTLKQRLGQVDNWLRNEAIAEARAKADDYNLTRFQGVPEGAGFRGGIGTKLTPGDRTGLNEYLFGSATLTEANLVTEGGLVTPESTGSAPPAAPSAERVTAAAIRLPDGRVFTGVNHPEAMTAAQDALDAEAGTTALLPDGFELGFQSTQRDFLTSEEGTAVGKTAQQIPEALPLGRTKAVAQDFGTQLEGPFKAYREKYGIPEPTPVVPVPVEAATEGAAAPKTPETEPTPLAGTEQEQLESLLGNNPKGRYTSWSRSLDAAVVKAMRGFFHGSRVNQINSDRAQRVGQTHSGWENRAVLERLETAGLIQRGDFKPGEYQEPVGAGGMRGPNFKTPERRMRGEPEAFTWTLTPRGLRVQELLDRGVVDRPWHGRGEGVAPQPTTPKAPEAAKGIAPAAEAPSPAGRTAESDLAAVKAAFRAGDRTEAKRLMAAYDARVREIEGSPEFSPAVAKLESEARPFRDALGMGEPPVEVPMTPQQAETVRQFETEMGGRPAKRKFVARNQERVGGWVLPKRPRTPVGDADALAAYFTPGEAVEGGRVVAYEDINAAPSGWQFRVTVQALDEAGNPVTDEAPVQHGTPPQRGEFERAMRARGAWPAEGEAVPVAEAKKSRRQPVPNAINPKYRLDDNAALERRLAELYDRFEESQSVASKESHPWTRFDPNIQAVRSGTVITGRGGRAIGAMIRDGRLIDEIEAELKGRGVDVEAWGRRYSEEKETRQEMAAEREAIAAEGQSPEEVEAFVDAISPEPRPAGAPADQAAVQEGLFGERTLTGAEQAELLPATAGIPTAKLKGGKITAEEMGRVRREGAEPEGERPLEMFGGGGGGTAASYAAETGPMEAKIATIPAKEATGRTLKPIAPVELVRLVKDILGKNAIFLKKYPRARGMFYGDPLDPRIGLNPELGKDYDQFAKTLAHEIGHLVDFVPDLTLARGNILGRIATLRGFMSSTIDALPTDPSKVLTPKDRVQIRRQAEKAVGKQPPKDEEADRAAWQAEVAREYAERITDEMEARHLIGKEQVMEELRLLSEWWRPWPADVTDSYRRYRESGKEVYADAVSVLLNSPGSLQEKAPVFFDAFLAYIERKPAAAKEYQAVQDLLAVGDDAVYAARREELEADFALGEELRKASEQRREKQSGWNYIKQMFLSRGAPLVAAERRRVGRRTGSSEDYAIKQALQEYNHADNVNRLLLMDLVKDVQQPMTAAGITQDQAGMYLMLTRIAEGDRGGMAEEAKAAIMEMTGETEWPAAKEAYGRLRPAEGEGESDYDADLLAIAESGVLNPHGYTPEEAKRQLGGLQKEMGPQRYGELEGFIGRLREILSTPVDEAARIGVYSQEAYQTRILPNRTTYAPFAVLDYFNGRVPAGLRRQIGTVKGVANPYTTAILKAMALNRLNESQKVKQAILKTIDQDFGDVGPERAIDKYNREARPASGRANLVYHVDGKLRYREMDGYIVKALESSDLGALQRFGQMIATPTYRFFHPLYVMWSIGWQTRNLPRDFKRTYKNLAAAYAGKPTYAQVLGAFLDVPKVLGAYGSTMGSAYRHARRRPDALIRKMLEDRAMGRAFHSFDPFEGSSTVERLAERYGLLKPPHEGLKGTLMNLGRPVEIAGVLQETWTKAAAYKLLGGMGITGKQRAYMVRNYTGTPDSSDRGLASDAVNALYLYSNVILAGWKADLEIATNPTTASGWWFRAVLMDFLPKMLAAAAALGWLGMEYKEWMDHIPSYEKEKYLIVPVPPFYKPTKDGKMKAIYLRIPHDDVNRVPAATTWAFLMDDRPHAPSRAVSIVAGEFPGINPGIDLVGKWVQFAGNRNPYDAFRARPVVSTTEWEAGGWDRSRGMLKYTLGEFGVASSLADWFGSLAGVGFRDEPGEQAEGEFALRHTPVLSSLVRMSNRGLTEERWWELEWENQHRAQLRADLSDGVRRAVQDRSRYNRFGIDRLDEHERARRDELNSWYRSYYLPLTAEMETHRDNKDDAAYRAAARRLDESLGAPPLPRRTTGPRPARPSGPAGPIRPMR